MLFLMTLLTSCGTTSEPTTRFVQVYPTDMLLQPCDINKSILEKPNINNEDLITYTKQLELSLRNCNDDKALMQKWKQQNVGKQADK